MPSHSDPALHQIFLTAIACHQRGDLDGAEAIYSRLLALDPADTEALYFFGHLKANRGDLQTGLECLQMAGQLKPDNPDIPFSMGVVLQQNGFLAEAIEAYRSAVAIAPAHLAAWENLCAALYDKGDFLAGLAASKAAIALNPESPLAIRGMANCLTSMGRRAEALATLEQGLKYHPALPEFRIHHAWELMANGHWREGWREWEWRNLRRGESDPLPRSVPYPRWNGEALKNKTILVYGEQGIGDEVMYAPFVHGLIKAGAHCILECAPRLEKAFSQAFPECIIMHRDSQDQIAWHSSLPEIDYCISSLSLPLYFTHPLERGAFLSADPDRVRDWKIRLAKVGTGLKIGVSWRGGADAKARAIRSIPAHIFGELISGEATFVSLQYGVTEKEAAAISPHLHIFHDINPLQDLDEFFALISALDVVISVDNSTVHFAGALGTKSLALLPVYAEWRWGNTTTGESPWYRSLEILRQSVASEDGWKITIQNAKEWLSSHSPSSPPHAPLRSPIKKILLCHKNNDRSALLIADTNFWYHWGCSCTSLGLHEGLRTRFDRIYTLSLARLTSGCPTPSTLNDLDSEVFYTNFRNESPDIIQAMQENEYIVINGEGSIHGASPLTLLLLYLAYIAKTRLGKKVAIINHSCHPGELALPCGNSTSNYYKKVYTALDLSVTRESISHKAVNSFGGKNLLGFDSLPIFIKNHKQDIKTKKRETLIIGGSVSWSHEMVDCFANIAKWAFKQGLNITILSGAKALLASDEVGFVEQIVKTLSHKKVPHALHFPISEIEWLEAIGTAKLVISGRFHYSIAAAFLRTPFLVTESNTSKIIGLLHELNLNKDLIYLAHDEYHQAIKKAKKLLNTGENSLMQEEIMRNLLLRSSVNFSNL